MGFFALNAQIKCEIFVKYPNMAKLCFLLLVLGYGCASGKEGDFQLMNLKLHFGFIRNVNQRYERNLLMNNRKNYRKTNYEKKLEQFIEEHGYIPKIFNAYNKKEYCDYIPCLTTNNYPSGKSAIMIIELEEEKLS